MNRGDLDAERRRSSLETLEGDDWGEPNYNSQLVITCHRLRKKPIGTFTVEDLRIMIGQRIGLAFLVPIALEVVERDPLAQGDFYPGDLLSALLRAGCDYWMQHTEERGRMHAILASLPETPKEIGKALEEWRKVPG